MRAPCWLVEAASLGPIGEDLYSRTYALTCRDLGDREVRHNAASDAELDDHARSSQTHSSAAIRALSCRCADG
jgi:hypothetical protein